MPAETPCPVSRDDLGFIARVLGREPRCIRAVTARCSAGRPRVIVTDPTLDDGTPFPTVYWLVCPMLRRAIGRLESIRLQRSLEERVRTEYAFAAALAAAQTAYADSNRSAGGHAVSGSFIAGVSDPYRVKCLHAHLAAWLAGVPTPVGGVVAVTIGLLECDGAWPDVCTQPST